LLRNCGSGVAGLANTKGNIFSHMHAGMDIILIVKKIIRENAGT